MKELTQKEIYDSMLAERYRFEQDSSRGKAIEVLRKLVHLNVAIEANTGLGNLTKLYREHFGQVITNDLNRKSIAHNHMDSLKFAKQLVAEFPQKIDLIDFDAYRCPAEEVTEIFKRLHKDVPVVVCISDGLGLWMKRRNDVERIAQRFKVTKDGEDYLLANGEHLDVRHPWRQHIELWHNLFSKLCVQYSLDFEPIEVFQTRGKNYVIGSYLVKQII